MTAYKVKTPIRVDPKNRNHIPAGTVIEKFPAEVDVDELIASGAIEEVGAGKATGKKAGPEKPGPENTDKTDTGKPGSKDGGQEPPPKKRNS